MSANTFAIYGTGHVKELTELVPGILNQLGPDSLASLRKLAESYQAIQQGQQRPPVGAAEDDDDDDVDEEYEDSDDSDEDSEVDDEILNSLDNLKASVNLTAQCSHLTFSRMTSPRC